MAARDGARPVGVPGAPHAGLPPQDVIGQPVPIILPDPATLFARRADRLAVLAEGHPMAAWLHFMASLARAQQVACDTMPRLPPIELVAGLPPLAADTHPRDPSWRAALSRVLELAADPAVPEPARVVLAGLRGQDPEPLATQYLLGRVPAARAGEAMAVAAALQVYFACRAAALPVAALSLLPQRGLCPVCGSAPVAGVITAAGTTPGVRYLHCGLCATAWNHARAVCVGCGESKGLALQAIEDGSRAVKAETCDMCHGYLKMVYQAEDMDVDPMADDLASLGLDLLVSEAGWSRLAPNPLVLAG